MEAGSAAFLTAAVAAHRLDDLGSRVGRPRQDHETATAYAVVLAERYGDDRLVAAGQVIDDAIYGWHPQDPARQGAIDAVLAEVAAGPVPDPIPPVAESEPVGTG